MISRPTVNSWNLFSENAAITSFLYMCHSGRPFCTRQVRVFGLVGRTPGFSARITQFRRLREPPGLSKASKPPMHASGYNFVYLRMHGSAHQNRPIKGGTLASVVSQSLTLELSTTLDLAETSALDYYTWYVVPFEGEKLLSSHRSSFSA